MPVRIVLDYPNGQLRHAALRLLRVLLGSLMVAIGLLATIVLIPTGFITAGDVMATFSHEKEPLFAPNFPLRESEAAFVASLMITIIGIRYGRRLVRGRRSTVLFLRRFGFHDSMQAVTFAVVHTLGTTWRLVTLDDAAIAPVGVESMPRAAFRAGGGLFELAKSIGKAAIVAYQWCMGGMFLIIGLEFVRARDWHRVLTDGTLEPYARIFATVMERRLPVHDIGPTLPGIFAVLMTIVAGSAVVFVIGAAAVFLSLPFFGFVIMASSSAEALRKAEAAKVRPVSKPRDVSDTVYAVSNQGRQTFAPRLTVLRVDGALWQQTVSGLAGVTSASVIDVSDPTEHLLWEMNELERLCPGRWIIIGEQGRLRRLLDENVPETERAAIDGSFARWLDSRAVLAYTTDRRGMRRFARALYGMLLDVERRRRPGVGY